MEPEPQSLQEKDSETKSEQPEIQSPPNHENSDRDSHPDEDYHPDDIISDFGDLFLLRLCEKIGEEIGSEEMPISDSLVGAKVNTTFKKLNGVKEWILSCRSRQELIEGYYDRIRGVKVKNNQPQKESYELWGNCAESSPEQSPMKKVQEGQVGFGLRQEFKVSLLDEDNEFDSLQVTYELPYDAELNQELKMLSEILREYRNVREICTFKMSVIEPSENQKHLIKVVVSQINQFPSQEMVTSLPIHKIADMILEIYNSMETNRNKWPVAKYFSNRSLSVHQNLIKFNMVHGLLENYSNGKDKETGPASVNLCQIMDNLFERKCFQQQFSSIPLKYTWTHFKHHLMTAKSPSESVVLHHPLFMNSSQKVNLFNESSEYNKQVSNPNWGLLPGEPLYKESGYKAKVSHQQKNAILDWTEYFAFRNSVDNQSEPSTSYNWIHPQLKELVIDFNIFLKNNPSVSHFIKEDRFTFQLRFVRNLLFHTIHYQEKLQTIFKTCNPLELVGQIEKIFPRLITFTYDYFRIEQAYFNGLAKETKEYKPLLQFGFWVDNPKADIVRQNWNIVDILKHKYLDNYIQSRIVNKHSEEVLNKGQYWEKTYGMSNQGWIKKANLTDSESNELSSIQKDVEKKLQNMLRYKDLADLLCLHEMISRSQIKNKKRMVEAYMNAGCPFIAYSCYNLLEQKKNMPDSMSSQILARRQKSQQGPEFYPYQKRPEFYPPQRVQEFYPHQKRAEFYPSPIPKQQTRKRTCQNYCYGKCPSENKCKEIHPQPCSDYLQHGKCDSGNACQFLHPNQNILCRKSLQGQCFSSRKCRKSHLPICKKFYNNRKGCEYGDGCKFYHPPVAICQHFKDDFCTKPNCRFYHASDVEIPNSFF